MTRPIPRPPERPSISEVDAYMRDISDLLGEQWLAANLSGRWVFTVSGKAAATNAHATRSLPKSLVQALTAHYARPFEVI